MEHELRRAGLTENEARVYIALLRLGSTTSGPLIKQLGMHRAAVYDTLDMLVEKGLVSFVIKANRKYFEAHDPGRLLEYIESKKQQLGQQARALESEISKLRALRAISKEAQEGYVYKGTKGIKSVCEDVLRTGETWLVFGSKGNFYQMMPAYFVQMQKRRADLGIKMRIIRNASTRGAKWSKNIKLREERFLPDKYTTPSTTFIYGTRSQ